MYFKSNLSQGDPVTWMVIFSSMCSCVSSFVPIHNHLFSCVPMHTVALEWAIYFPTFQGKDKGEIFKPSY